jgi:hypothetical protein
MVKSTKSTPPRKPIKARGALPTPKTAPQRPHKRWYRRQGWQLVAIVVAIAVIGGAWAAGGTWLKNRREAKVNSEAVAQFDRRYSVLKSPVVDVLTAMTGKTSEFASGTLSGPDLKKETDTWLVGLRKMDSELRKREIPRGLPELDEARAVLVQGYLVFIDGVKAYALASTAPDPAIKDQALKQGNNLVAHGDSIVSTGERLLDKLKTRFEVGEVRRGQPGAPDPAGQPIQLPSEEAPASGQAGAPGTPGAGTGMPPGAGGVPGAEAPGGGQIPGGGAPGAAPNAP